MNRFVPPRPKLGLAALLSAATLGIVVNAMADDVRSGKLLILDPHIDMLPETAQNAPVAMTIVNNGEVPDALLSVRTTRSRSSALMQMQIFGPLLRQVPVDSFEIPPGESVSLNSMGRHLILSDLTAPLTLGETFVIVLEFEHAGSIEVEVAVQASAFKDPSAKASPANNAN